jgi:hypothetical protein
MTSQERSNIASQHTFRTPETQEFEPPRQVIEVVSDEGVEIPEVEIPIAETRPVHDLSEALALSAAARGARQRHQHFNGDTRPHAA